MLHGKIIAVMAWLSCTPVSGRLVTVYRIWNRGYSITGLRVDDVHIAENETETPGIFYQRYFSSSVKFIEVVNSTLTVLPPKSFGRNYYWGLYLSNVHINKILPGAFKGVTRLEELDLSHNNISRIDYGVYNDFEELMFVNFSHNNIRTIAEDAFNGTIFLKELRLQNNKISTLSDQLFNSQKLSLNVLNISFNYLEVIKETFMGLRNLTELHLHYNNISTMAPNSLQGLVALKYLDISHNNLSQLRYGLFNSLERLEYLNFSHNTVSKFPVQQLNHLTKLKELRYKNNKIFLDGILQSLLLYFPALQKIDADGLNRSCSDLLNILVPLQARNVSIVGENNYTTDNIRGITCHIENNYLTTDTQDTTDRSNVTDVPYNNLLTVSQNKTMNEIKNTVVEISDLFKKYGRLLETSIDGSHQTFIFTIVMIIIFISITIMLIAALLYLLIKLNRKQKYKCQETLLTENRF